jgi:RNA polymerase sigma factor (sigma-70 family)
LAAAPAGRATRIERRVAPESEATRELYERYSEQIFGYCLHRLGNREEAEDAVQSTFLNAFRGLSRGVVPESDSAWLFKIAENVCHSRHRSSWRRGRVESPSDLDAFQDVLPAPPRAQDELIPLGEALERLPENQRRAILLREWQGLSYREIAEELDLSQSAVETLIFRARRSLVAGLESPAAPRRRTAVRRARQGLDIGGVVGALKLLFAGGTAVKVAAVAVAVTGATVAVGHRRHSAVPAVPAASPVRPTRRPAPPVVQAQAPAASTKRRAVPLRKHVVAAPPRTPVFVAAWNPSLPTMPHPKPAAPKHPPPAPPGHPPSPAGTIGEQTPPVVVPAPHPPVAPAGHEEPAPPPPTTTTPHDPPPPEPTTTAPAQPRPATPHHQTTTTRTAEDPHPPETTTG